MKKIFIAATKQNDGKTTVSLGLISNLRGRFSKVAFIKPIGQRYLQEEGQKIDEDSLLIEKVCKIKGGLKDMSPIAVEKGFTERYIAEPRRQFISSRIKESFARVTKGQDLIVIEGTGHAGVGSVFDHSNAYVARLLGSKVIIISSGGIGRPIDEVLLNKALFDKEGVKILGVIINKVLPSKFDKINQLVRKGLERKGIKVLGVVPYNNLLSQPSIEQIFEETKFELLCGKDALETYVSNIIVGAMEPCDAARYIVEDSFLIIPGDREDMISMVLGCCRQDGTKRLKISGMVLTGGIVPGKATMEALVQRGIPVLLAKEHTYAVASCIHDLTVKMRPRDTAKINTAVQLIKEYVNLDAVSKGM